MKDPETIKVELDLKECREQYARYLKGKRVVIIGPAPSILNSKQQEYIEEFDVIVRLNKAVPVPQDLAGDIGTRTDVLYNCMNPSPECGDIINIDLLHKNGVKFLISPYANYKEFRFGKDIVDFARRNLKSKAPISFCHFDTKLFARLMELIKLPNTGINAILDILQHDIKELYITGLTFFKGGYIKQYRGYSEQQVLARMAKYNLHDQDKQLAYMQKILKNNPRVKMDAALKEIIEGPTKLLPVDAEVINEEINDKKSGTMVVAIAPENTSLVNIPIEIKSKIPANATILATTLPKISMVNEIKKENEKPRLDPNIKKPIKTVAGKPIKKESDPKLLKKELPKSVRMLKAQNGPDPSAKAKAKEKAREVEAPKHPKIIRPVSLNKPPASRKPSPIR